MPNCNIPFVRFVEDWESRLRNANRLLPVFEAVSNAFHAIQDKQKKLASSNDRPGLITVELVKNCKTDKIDVIKISDDGVGFNDENLASFQQIYSNKKEKIGGKGVGHVSWLAAFENILVESVYEKTDGTLGKRKISFSLQNENNVDVEELDVLDVSSTSSVVVLSSVKPSFRSLASKTVEDVAVALFNHFFLELTKNIGVVVKCGEEEIDLLHWRIKTDALNCDVKGKEFCVTTSKKSTTVKAKKHQVFYCANGRVVEEIDFEALCGVSSTSPFCDEKLGTYFVGVYVESDYFNQIVDKNRTSFNFVENDLFNDGTKPTREEINQCVKSTIHKKCKQEFERLETQKKDAVDKFLLENPLYRSIRKYADKELQELKWNAKDEDVELAFHIARRRVELNQRRLLDSFVKLDPETCSAQEAAAKLQECLESIDATKRADLTSYVLKRKLVVEILESLLTRKNGKYHAERQIHDLIFPMKTTSKDEEAFSNNVWLIDDKLIPYEFIASDTPIKNLPEVVSDSNARPDLLAFDNPMAFAIGDECDVELGDVSSLVVVEFKRPMRDDFDDKSNPIDQVIDYVDKLKAGYENEKGRRVRLAPRARIYCYIIADITASLKRQCYFLHPTQDGKGFFGSTPQDGAHVEVISYDKLLSDAKKRNNEFFNRLSLKKQTFVKD